MRVTPRVVDVKALDKTHIYIKFADGKEKVYDMSNLIETNQFYSNLKERSYFETVRPSGVSVSWPNGEDVCPENLYYESVDYSEFNK